MASSNSDQFNKSDRTEELPLADLLNHIHEEERMGEDELLEMIEGYWRMAKEELAKNPVHRRMIPMQVQLVPRPSGIRIQVDVENGPYFEAGEDMATSAMGKAAERFRKRFEAEARLFVENRRKSPFNNKNGKRLTAIFSILPRKNGNRSIYWSSGDRYRSPSRAIWGHTMMTHEWMCIKQIQFWIGPQK